MSGRSTADTDDRQGDARRAAGKGHDHGQAAGRGHDHDRHHGHGDAHGHDHQDGGGHDGDAGHQVDTEAVILRAKAFASARKVPFTEMRERVLRLLSTTGQPMTAYEIADRLSAARKVQAVQIYRALDFLQEAGCVHRLSSLSSYLACDHPHQPGDAVVFMICSHCGQVQETVSELVAEGLRNATAETRFRPVHPMVEIEGACTRCAGNVDAAS